MASTATPSTAPTPGSYSDIAGTPIERYVTGLSQLGVFGTPGGAFDPDGTITRGEFAKWLVLANNGIFENAPEKKIALSHVTKPAYSDVPPSHPDFPYVQGLKDAGFAVGFPDGTFKPDAPLTREQMIAMKATVDRGGTSTYYVISANSMMPNWKDAGLIATMYRGAIAEDSALDKSAVANWDQPRMAIGNVSRAFGPIASFEPQATVTRGQAAAVLWKMGPHNTDITNPEPENLPRSVLDEIKARLQDSTGK